MHELIYRIVMGCIFWRFFHNSGMVPLEPLEWDFKLGELLRQPKI